MFLNLSIYQPSTADFDRPDDNNGAWDYYQVYYPDDDYFTTENNQNKNINIQDQAGCGMIQTSRIKIQILTIKSIMMTMTMKKKKLTQHNHLHQVLLQLHINHKAHIMVVKRLK